MRYVAIVIACSLLTPALAIDIGNVTISDTLVVPPGETGELFGTVTFDSGVIDVQGSLHSNFQSGDIDIVGEGRIELSTADSYWNRSCCYSTVMTIGADVEVLGSPDASYSVGDTINLGVMAAVAGETDDPFDLFVYNDFMNEGVLEARAGGLLQLRGFSSNEAFSQSGVIRAHPGGVIHYESGDVTSLDVLGTFDNQGEIQFRRTEFNAGGGDLQFPTGDWAFLDGARIENATLSTSAGGRLLVKDYNLFWNYNAQPIELSNVTLASDIGIQSLAHVSATNLTLSNAAIHFEEYGGRLYLEPSDEALTGAGSLVADGTHGFLYAQGPVEIGADVTLESRSGALALLADSSIGDASYDIAGTMLADGGRIEIRKPTTSRGLTTVRNGGALEVEAPLHVVGDLRVESGGLLVLDNQIQNDGAVTIENGALLLGHTGEFTTVATVSLQESVVVVRSFRTLSDVTQYTGENVDYAVDSGSLDLEGATLSLTATPGQQWFFSGGQVRNGVINSSDGSQLVPQQPAVLGAASGNVSLSDIELNADAHIPAGAKLTLAGSITGSGRVIVDGGQLDIGAPNGDSTTLVDSMIPRVDPLAGEVTLHGMIDNQGKTLHLPAGVRWGYSHSRADGIVGGRIEGEAGAELHVDNGYGGYSYGYATFQEGVEVALPVVISNTRAYVRGGLTLDQTHLTIGDGIQPNSIDTRLIFLRDQTLSGNGEVRFGRLAQSPAHYIEVEPDADSTTGLTIGEGIVVRTTEGSGAIQRWNSRSSGAHTPLTNHGLLIAENGHQLALFTSDFAQHGTLRTETNSLLLVNDDNVTNNGRIEIADGAMEFTGDLTQAANSVLAVELSSDLLAAVEAPLTVGGATVLGGRLEVSLADGFALAAGDAFTLLSAGAVSGSFRGVVGPTLDDGLFWQVELLADEVRLNIATGAPVGDFNSDGVVDAADYAMWRDNLGSPAGTLANDPHASAIGEAQYATWKANFGATSSLATATPEPEALALLLLTTLLGVATSHWRPSRQVVT